MGRSLDQTRARRYARSIQSSLRSAQIQAVSLNHCVRARFNIKSGTQFRIQKYSKRTCETRGGNWKTIPGLSNFKLPDSIEIYSAGQNSASSSDDSGEACLLFSPDGGVNHVYPCNDSSPKDPGSRGHPYIHLGPAGQKFPGPDPCRFVTVFTIRTSSAPQPQMLPFGAHDEFTVARGDDPC